MIAQEVFDNLYIHNTYVLPDSVLDIINTLCLEIGYDSNITPTFINQYNAASASTSSQTKSGGFAAPAKVVYDGRVNYQRQQARKQNVNTRSTSNTTGNDWATKQKFSITKFATLDATKTLLNEIRSELNKITEKNWEARIDVVFKHIDDICEACELDGSDEDEAIKDVFVLIFNAAVLNKMATTYAKIFEKIYSKYPTQIREFIDVKWDEYMKSMEGIVDVSETDYDAFCAFNFANSARKNKSVLFAEIAKHRIFDGMLETVDSAIGNLLNQVVAKIEYREKSKEVEEITENLVILFQTLGNNIDKTQYVPIIAILATYKNGDKPGLTSRTRFKYGDMK